MLELDPSPVQCLISPKWFASCSGHESCDSVWVSLPIVLWLWMTQCGLNYPSGKGVRGAVTGFASWVLSNAAAVLTLLSSPLQVRSLTSARGKGASGVLHGATSSRGITESTRVQSPLNATIVTGNAASSRGVWAKCGHGGRHGAASSLRAEAWPSAQRLLLALCPTAWVPEPRSAQRKRWDWLKVWLKRASVCCGHRIQSIGQLFLILCKQRGCPEGPRPLQGGLQKLTGLTNTWVYERAHGVCVWLLCHGCPKSTE